MTDSYDFIIIGAGHNGLVAAGYLTKRGKKVLVLERREVVGGQAVSETFGNGFTADSLQAGGRLRPDIVKDLRLSAFGLQAEIIKGPFILLVDAQEHLVLDADPVKAAESIRRFSEKDAAAWPSFIAFMEKASRFIHKANATIMPRLPKGFNPGEGMDLAGLGISLRGMGGKDMMRIVRGIPMTAEEFADEWFEAEAVRGAVASLGIHGLTLGPMGAGTGYSLMHNWANRGGLAQVAPAGGVGNISESLAAAVKGMGGEIRTGAEVAKILVEPYTCKGVVLTNGEEVQAKVVISAADPKHTLLSLVGAANLPPEYVWQVQSIKMRGSVAKVHLLTDGEHGLPAGTIVVAPSIKYLEQAYDAAKYGRISEKPYLEVTTSGKVVSIHFQYAPYHLRNGDWKAEKEKVELLAIETLSAYFPALKSRITQIKTITPLEMEETYGLTEGDLNHGQLMLDQFMFMRPIPGWSNHRTPIDNLYLCGSGVHGGGGISGAPGRNIVKVLK